MTKKQKMGNNSIVHTCLQLLASSEPVMKYEAHHAVYYHAAFFETGYPIIASNQAKEKLIRRLYEQK